MAQDVLVPPTWHRYLGAALLTAAVVAARFALNPWWGVEQNRHLVLLPTVTLAAWVGGFGPGALSSALCTLALYLFWSRSQSLIHLPGADVLLFLPFSLVICSLINSLQLARARANAATRSREQILEIVAHDLRGPLTAIDITVRGMARNSPTVQPALDRIQRAVARMDKLVADLIDSTRIDQGKLSVSAGPQRADVLVHDTVELFAPLARDRQITLEERDIPPGLIVHCDRDRILQVLGNLVGNALRFTPEGGRVTLTVEDEGASVAIAHQAAVRFGVADTGSGISAANLDRVFQQYWKADPGGTGLGLFIARSIVIAHGGRIWAESKPGEGAAFFFTLPRGVTA